jgi:catechol 2,3-dioxygenase-like lactoylglutathione lyase family enzyme
VEIHTGRLIDHLHLRVRDVGASRRFYGAVLGALGRDIVWEGEFNGSRAFSADELFVSADAAPSANVHLSFQAESREAVERFHREAIAAGGVDHGGPGERDYHPGYYGAFVLDPDGNNIEATYHGPTRRSARSVVIAPAG